MTTSRHILYNSLFTNHPNIRHYIRRPTLYSGGVEVSIFTSYSSDPRLQCLSGRQQLT